MDAAQQSHSDPMKLTCIICIYFYTVLSHVDTHDTTTVETEQFRHKDVFMLSFLFLTFSPDPFFLP